jgi:hypothetical protein
MAFHGFATSLPEEIFCCSWSDKENYEESTFYTIYSDKQVISGSSAHQETENTK